MNESRFFFRPHRWHVRRKRMRSIFSHKSFDHNENIVIIPVCNIEHFILFFRYQYYLQLKADVIEGKLPCGQEQAVLLASYSVQGGLIFLFVSNNKNPYSRCEILFDTFSFPLPYWIWRNLILCYIISQNCKWSRIKLFHFWSSKPLSTLRNVQCLVSITMFY